MKITSNSTKIPISTEINSITGGIFLSGQGTYRNYTTEPSAASSDSSLEKENYISQKKLWKVDAEHRIKPKKTIYGAIISVNDTEVLCNFELSDSETVEALLSPDIFPESVQAGTTFSLEIIEDRGYKTPIVEILHPDPTDTPESKEIEKIIQQYLS